MFLNAVILVLQEILEAALLISVLAVLASLLARTFPQLGFRMRWIPLALCAGLFTAWLYAAWMPEISTWFDYVGQEIANALIQFCIVMQLMLYTVLLNQKFIAGDPALIRRLTLACQIGVVALVLMREGSEIILYLYGIMGQREYISAVMLGSIMGAGIGLSCGVFLFYGLTSLSPVVAIRLTLVLLALFAGNMMAQAVLLLTQADWLLYTPQLWDSSQLLPEYSIAGQLLYALIGYDANPSLAQAIAYVLTVVIILLSPLVRTVWSRKETE